MNKPLADRIRPTELDDVVGQKHLLGEGKALRRLIEAGDIPNLIKMDVTLKSGSTFPIYFRQDLRLLLVMHLLNSKRIHPI